MFIHGDDNVVKYQLSFWFEHGGFCIWGKNKNAQEKYGYAIKNDSLPISENLIHSLDTLEKEYGSFLDWNNPKNSSAWAEDHKTDFINRATDVYEKLCNELGPEFDVKNEINHCVE